ncbi:hypothetical protein FA95DRAFT_1603297 [Auriscalpium vulgare]|uniref:Uncharacterized protein n=1 Tax=Auriscalpium vulgare TaxID=40419 RepID=A0ACB8S448_9AGAM|nr:hypothetical protein FA95DRAFT_1603297 [Auriscalpium vulgare]
MGIRGLLCGPGSLTTHLHPLRSFSGSPPPPAVLLQFLLSAPARTMCGIVFSAHWPRDTDSSRVLDELLQRLYAANTARGPDTRRTTVGGAELRFFGSELHLRGPAVHAPDRASQPGDILCWNGEIIDKPNLVHPYSDGARLFNGLVGCSDMERLPDWVARVDEPYALVYYHHASRRLFFARDRQGKRSLLVHRPTAETPYFLLTSVSVGPHEGYDLSEVDAAHVHMLDLRHLCDNPRADPASAFEACWHRVPRQVYDETIDDEEVLPVTLNRTLPSPVPEPLEPLDDRDIPSDLSSAVNSLLFRLSESVNQQIRSIAPVHPQSHALPDEPIDLLNVAFEDPRRRRGLSGKLAVALGSGADAHLVPDRVEVWPAAEAPRRLWPTRLWNFVRLPPSPSDLANLTDNGQLKRRFHIHRHALNGVSGHSNVSGPPEKASVAGQTNYYDPAYLAPDRVTGLRAVGGLRTLCPTRRWNFVEIDVSSADAQAARATVEALMWPSQTPADLHAAMGVYFAGRGTGQIRRAPDAAPEAFTSRARVLLSSWGVDALAGGHATAYGAGGWPAVLDELQRDLDGLHTNGLGRDDRVSAAHGKATCYPFLALGVVRLLSPGAPQARPAPRRRRRRQDVVPPRGAQGRAPGGEYAEEACGAEWVEPGSGGEVGYIWGDDKYIWDDCLRRK